MATSAARRTGSLSIRTRSSLVTRQALNRLRTPVRRREYCVGQWLPKPLLTSPDVGADIELAENLSIAMLTVLETLSPAERAVFVLLEVFDTPYERDCGGIGKSAAAVRQIAHRAREHVPLDALGSRSVPPRNRRLWTACLARSDTATCRAFSTSCPDLVLVADGGGVAPAARRPVEGAERVAGLLIGGLPSVSCGAVAVWLNGSPAIRVDADAALSAAVSVTVEDRRITRVDVVADSHKLAQLDRVTALARS